MNDDTSNKTGFSRIILHTIVAMTLGVFLFSFIWLASIVVDQIWNAGRIMPGISMGGIDLSGMDLNQAELRLEEGISISDIDQIHLSYAEVSLPIPISQLGISLDATASARNAFQFGRTGPLGSIIAYQFLGRHAGLELQPVVIFDEIKAYRYLQQIALEHDRPVKEAGLVLEGTRVAAMPGQVGRHLDITGSLDLLEDHIRRGEFSSVQLVVKEEQPQLLDASFFASRAQEILSRPFNLIIPEGQADDGNSFSISPERMAPMLSFERVQDNGETIIQLKFREDLLIGYLSDLAGQTAIQAQNPRFIFNDDTRELDLLSPAVTGRELNVQDSLAAIQTSLASQKNSAVLSFNNLVPGVSDHSTADELMITELIREESSYFFGSSEPRIQNIEKASSEFHGLLVAPGETFSMASNMEDISLDNGYSEALIIYNGRTIEGVGGGVCQVSTTLFRTAFFAGFPIEERYPHAYRVSYYEKTAGNRRDSDLAGLDATVFIPLVDLKFTNDTPYWLLMETYVNRAANRLTWKFYSTSDGRSVEWQTTGPVNIVEPKKPLYKENPDLDAGEIKQVDYEADGADVRVDRFVYRDGERIISDTFHTHYEPWRAIYEYGPGTKGIPESSND